MKLSCVVAAIEGGLGNQLFQFSAGLALSRHLHCDLALDTRGLLSNGDRPLYLTQYPINARIISGEIPLPDLRPKRLSRLKSRASLWSSDLIYSPVYWARTVGYDEQFFCIPSPRLIVGYWQNERYFKNLRSDLLTLLHPEDAHAVQGLVERVKADKSVSIHVRRGDYITNASAAQIHGSLDMDYYSRAVVDLKKRIGTFKGFVFTDDPDWVHQNLRLDTDWELVEGHSGAQAHLDLEIMRHCQHHIIANSTFSWWGAWLGDAQGKLVIAPRQWFASSRHQNPDLIPEEWIRI